MVNNLEIGIDPSNEDPVGDRPPRAIPARLAARIRGNANFFSPLVSAAATLVLIVPLYRLWRAPLRVPFHYGGDANAHAVLVKAVLDHGWYERNPNLGAPFEQRFNDFPMGDNLHLFVMKMLGIVTDDYGLVVNAYYLLAFLLIALTATWVLRKLSFAPIVACAVGVLYALLPYHFQRGESHLFLGAYYTVPLSIYLVLMIMQGGGALFRSRSWSLIPRLSTVVMIVVAATASSYYAVFTAVLVGVAMLMAMLSHDIRRSLFRGVVVIALLLGTVVVNVLPDLAFRRAHGQNTELAARSPQETEVYALKLAQLLLPMPHHRIESLAEVRRQYDRDFPLPSETPALGMAAAVGFLGLLALLFVRVVRPSTSPWSDQQGRFAVIAAAGFLIASVGGFSTLISLFVSDLMRGWNRMLVFIAFVALAAVGMAYQQLRARLASPRARRALVAAATVAFVLAVIDQTSPAFVPPYERIAEEFNSDRQFVDAIEALLPDGAMVYQLPFVPYPEHPPVVRMVDYDHLRGYLHSQSLRWSYGGMKGRIASDWQKNLGTLATPDLLRTLVAVGFTGLYIDRFGYEDEAAILVRDVAGATGETPLNSPNGRLVFFDLRGFAEHTRQTTPPVEIARLADAALRDPD